MRDVMSAPGNAGADSPPAHLGIRMKTTGYDVDRASTTQPQHHDLRRGL
jgi:hypothetical protein